MRARRTDANLTDIVAAYRRAGCIVDITNGRWDLTVQYRGLTELVEVKDGAKSPSRRKLTRAEEKTHATMAVRIVQSLNDVMAHVHDLRAARFGLK